jgi:hypothetical protein
MQALMPSKQVLDRDYVHGPRHFSAAVRRFLLFNALCQMQRALLGWLGCWLWVCGAALGPWKVDLHFARLAVLGFSVPKIDEPFNRASGRVIHLHSVRLFQAMEIPAPGCIEVWTLKFFFTRRVL